MPGPPAGTEHLRPWLSGVFVIPERRKAGLGPTLVATVEEAAGTLGYPTLYLYTAPVTARKFYAPLGWEVILTPSYEGKEVAVMAKSLVVPGKLGSSPVPACGAGAASPQPVGVPRDPAHRAAPSFARPG